MERTFRKCLSHTHTHNSDVTVLKQSQMITFLFSIGLLLESVYRCCRGHHTLSLFPCVPVCASDTTAILSSYIVNIPRSPFCLLCLWESQWGLISWLAVSFLVYTILLFSSCSVCCMLILVSCFSYSSALKMEAVYTSKTSVDLPHHVTFPETAFSIARVMRTSNPTRWIIFSCNFTTWNVPNNFTFGHKKLIWEVRRLESDEGQVNAGKEHTICSHNRCSWFPRETVFLLTPSLSLLSDTMKSYKCLTPFMLTPM